MPPFGDDPAETSLAAIPKHFRAKDIQDAVSLTYAANRFYTEASVWDPPGESFAVAEILSRIPNSTTRCGGIR